MCSRNSWRCSRAGDPSDRCALNARTIYCPRLLGPHGWLRDSLIRVDAGGRILGVESGAPGDADLALRGAVVPGMPNCHSHAFQRQMAGLAGHPGPDRSDSFWTWRETMYRLANRLGADALEAIARWLYVEMLEAGYTSCAEFHYLHHQPDGAPHDNIEETGARLLGAAGEAGLALTLLPVLYCRGGFDHEALQVQQRRFGNTPDQFLALFERLLDRVAADPHHVIGLAFHSLRAVSRQQMEEVLGAEGGRAMAVHIHVAEQQAEVAQCLATYGARPVEWLLDHAPVDERWCLVHATHMSPGEHESAAGRGAIAGLCPTTEADLGDGFFEAERWLGHGGRIAVGSDSNLRISPAEELRVLEFGVRLRTGRRNVLADGGKACGRTLYEAACEGGRLALGQPVGRVAEGFRADLVELDDTHPMLCDVSDDDVLDRYLFAGDGRMIRSVLVGGRTVVREGRHEARDAAAAGFTAVMKELCQ